LSEGYNVVATSRDANPKFTTSVNLILLDGDISKQQTAADAVEAAINNFGAIDVLVNNAGIFLTKPFSDFTAEDFNALLSTNLLGLFYITQRTVKEMLKQKSGCEYHRGACRPANSERKWLDVDDYEGWLKFSDPESRNRVCKGRHSL
jgi:NAD(P)-dependent dehydrogenase (short-subunit alcohol dehydrogenase family)